MGMAPLAILIAYGVILSYLAAKDAPIVSEPWFYGPATAVSLILYLWAIKANLEFGLALPLMLLAIGIVVGMTHAYFFASVAGNLITGIGRGFMGDGNLKVRPTYDKAESAVKAGDLELAVRLYAEGAQECPQDPTPHLRLADIAAQLNQWEPAVDHMRHAIDIAREPGQQSAVVFRLADLLNTKMKQPAAARQTLQQFIDGYPDSKEAEFARQRLENIGGE